MAGDIIDAAQRTEQMIIASALAGRNRPAQLTRSRTHCAECGAPIPQARQEAVPGCQLCRDCQEEYDNG